MRYLILMVMIMQASLLSGQTKEAAKVQKAVSALNKAILEADKSKLEDLTSSKLSYGHSSGVVDSKEVFVEKIVSGASDFVTMETSEETITISGNTAVVRHILKADTNDGGKPGKANIRVLQVWNKEGGHWKLLARQAVKNQ